jgi:hypothetical protein
MVERGQVAMAVSRDIRTEVEEILRLGAYNNVAILTPAALLLTLR